SSAGRGKPTSSSSPSSPTPATSPTGTTTRSSSNGSIEERAVAKLTMKERYNSLTRDLDWTPTYVDPADAYPCTRYEGIKIHDWDAWEDPFRLTVDSYCKYQAEKDKKLYAVIDSFAQGQGHLGLSDARYLNAIKLFLQGVTP